MHSRPAVTALKIYYNHSTHSQLYSTDLPRQQCVPVIKPYCPYMYFD